MTGRKSDYRAEYAAQLIKHMAEGHPFATFGALVGKSRKTLYNWVEAHDDFREAKERGDVLSEHWWWKKGMDHLVTHDKDTKFNVAVWIFTMKCRFGHRDGSEGNKDDKPPVDVPPTDTEIRAVLDLVSAKRKLQIA